MADDSLLARYGLPPAAIERESLRRIERSLGGRTFRSEQEREVVLRLVYAAGDLSLADHVRLSPGAAEAGVAALRADAPIICDVRMVAAGISAPLRERLGCPLLCAIAAPGAAERAGAAGITRTAAGLQLLAARLAGAVVAIGNAPTALLALLDLAARGPGRPALVVGMPVGFVAAAESKDLLAESGLPHITVSGTRGGSPLAAATVNLLLGWAAATHS